MHELTSEQLRDLKIVLKNALLQFDDTCSKVGASYFLSCGTLLGAARHKGFIPWDDDIDVMMTMDQYLKLRKGWSSFAPDDLFLQDPENEESLVFPFAKVRVKGTEFVEEAYLTEPKEKGAYIDIFLIVPASNSYFVSKMRRKILKVFYHRMTRKIRYSKPTIKDFFSWLLTGFAKPQTITKKIFLRNQKCKKTKYVFVFEDFCRVLRADYFSKPRDIEFEGHVFPAFAEYDSYLREVYGDYLTLPPASERIPHHYVKRFDIPDGHPLLKAPEEMSFFK